MNIVWILSVAAAILAISRHWISVTYAIGKVDVSEALYVIFDGILFGTIMTIVHLMSFIGVRFVLELFSIIFDIRGLLKV